MIPGSSAKRVTLGGTRAALGLADDQVGRGSNVQMGWGKERRGDELGHGGESKGVRDGVFVFQAAAGETEQLIHLPGWPDLNHDILNRVLE